MHRFRPRAFVTAVAIAAVLLSIGAADANHSCTPLLTVPVDTPAGVGCAGGCRFYVDVRDDAATPGSIGNIWIYQESNGIDGLQRDGEVEHCQEYDENGDPVPADTVIF